MQTSYPLASPTLSTKDPIQKSFPVNIYHKQEVLNILESFLFLGWSPKFTVHFANLGFREIVCNTSPPELNLYEWKGL